MDKNGMIPQPIEPNGNTVEQKIADIEKRMRQYGDGARAIIRIQRMKQDAKGKISKIGGHVFMVEQINGKTVFCGHIEKANRNKNIHLFSCKNCGYKSNDDRIGAMNLYRMGINYLEDSQVPDTVVTE